MHDVPRQPLPVTPRAALEMRRLAVGFAGFVVSDAAAVMDLVPHGFARGAHDAAVHALRAGLDMEMWTGVCIATDSDPTPIVAAFSTLADAVQCGEVDAAVIDAAVRRILLLKLRLGLFEQPYVDESVTASILNNRAHRAIVRVAAERSAVHQQYAAFWLGG